TPRRAQARQGGGRVRSQGTARGARALTPQERAPAPSRATGVRSRLRTCAQASDVRGRRENDISGIYEVRRSNSGSPATGGPVNQTAHQQAADTATLGDREAGILDFERQWWRFGGAKETAIREQFAMSATEYYQVLNALLDSEHALAYDPMLVKRLRRMR